MNAVINKATFIARVQGHIHISMWERYSHLAQNRNGDVLLFECVPVMNTDAGEWLEQAGTVVYYIGSFQLFGGWNNCVLTAKDFGIRDKQPVELSEYEESVRMVNSYMAKAANAKQAGHEFTLTIQEWINLNTNPICDLTGMPLHFGDIHDPQRFTVERKDPNKGYVKGNVVAMSYTANQAKSHVDAIVKWRGLDTKQKLRILRKGIYLLEKETKSA